MRRWPSALREWLPEIAGVVGIALLALAGVGLAFLAMVWVMSPLILGVWLMLFLGDCLALLARLLGAA